MRLFSKNQFFSRFLPLLLAIVLVASMIFAYSVINSSKVASAVIVEKRDIELNDGTKNIATIETDIDSQAESLTVRIALPTTASPLAWDESGTMKVNIILEVDGTEYRATGQVTGGIHTNPKTSEESTHYIITYSPPWGFFGARSGDAKRLGETKTGTYTARLELERISGNISTDVEMTYTIASAPAVQFHSSVAFDNVSSAQEIDGDGVLSVSHTSSGSNQAVFVGVGGFSFNGGSLGAATYAGTGMDEMWDAVFQTDFSHAGYQLAGQTTGPQTVTSDLVSTDLTGHTIGVISMTGVDQTTPVGTPTATSGTTANPSVTVSDVGADDLVVENFVANANEGPTIGADQDLRYDELDGDTFTLFIDAFGSTQLGSDGGVMSWTMGAETWGLGAVAFKPAAEEEPASTSPHVEVRGGSGAGEVEARGGSGGGEVKFRFDAVYSKILDKLKN